MEELNEKICVKSLAQCPQLKMLAMMMIMKRVIMARVALSQELEIER